MGYVIALANQKGGVGKTTTSVNLGACLADDGKKVLLIDLDPQGNATSGLGIDKKDIEESVYDVLINDVDLKDVILKSSHKGLDIVPTTIALSGAEVELTNLMARETRLKDAFGDVKDEYDYILIDCPPSLGLLTINAFTACDSILIPVQSEYYALEGLSQLLNTIKLVRKHFNPDLKIEGVLLTMYDKRTNLGQQVNAEVKKYFGDQVYDTIIPRNVRLSEAPSHGQAIVDYDKRSTGAKVYQQLAKEVLARHGEK
jgi:chromosome partitioning protein